MGACSRSKTFEPTGRVTAELSCAFRTQGHCLLTNIGNLKQSSFVWCTCWLLALFHITNLQILSESVHGTINHHSALIRPSCIAMDQCAKIDKFFGHADLQCDVATASVAHRKLAR